MGPPHCVYCEKVLKNLRVYVHIAYISGLHKTEKKKIIISGCLPAARSLRD